jgi:uncharacterized oxidoreductase
MKISGNTVLITGGASGIGLALAGAFYREKNTVIILGRSQDKLAQAQKRYPGLHTLQVDITSEQQRLELAETLTTEFPGLNLLVNNAGVAYFGDAQQPTELFKHACIEIDTNYLAPLHLSLLLLPQLRQQPSPAIVNITTAGVYLPLTIMPGYSASKAAFSSITHVLRQQLANTPLKVFEVLPPAVDTQLVSRFKVQKLQPDLLAQKIVSGIKKNHYDMPLGSARALKWLARLAPTFCEGILHRQMTKMLNDHQ